MINELKWEIKVKQCDMFKVIKLNVIQQEKKRGIEM